MRAVLSIVLAGLLVTTPLKQVLAQAAQQDSTTAETSVERERVVRVPPLTRETALLWQPLAEKRPGAFAEPSLSNRDAVPGWRDWSDEKKVILVAAVVVAVLLIVFCFEGEICGKSQI